MRAGGVMGWPPTVVKCQLLPDFMAAFEGWRDAHVPRDPDGPNLSEAEVAELEAIMNEGPQVSYSIKRKRRG